MTLHSVTVPCRLIHFLAGDWAWDECDLKLTLGLIFFAGACPSPLIVQRHPGLQVRAASVGDVRPTT